MKKRKGFEILYTEQQQSWRSNSCCPICGLPKSEWKRRTDWTCCSTKCSDEHNKVSIKYWPTVRSQIIKRDKYTCMHCGWKAPERQYMWENDPCFVVDHIIPIACGGSEWSEDNMQTLCPSCNKKKTKMDAARIAKHRLKEQLIKAGQKLFGDDE